MILYIMYFHTIPQIRLLYFQISCKMKLFIISIRICSVTSEFTRKAWEKRSVLFAYFNRRIFLLNFTFLISKVTTPHRNIINYLWDKNHTKSITVQVCVVAMLELSLLIRWNVNENFFLIHFILSNFIDTYAYFLYFLDLFNTFNKIIW